MIENILEKMGKINLGDKTNYGLFFTNDLKMEYSWRKVGMEDAIIANGDGARFILTVALLPLGKYL